MTRWAPLLYVCLASGDGDAHVVTDTRSTGDLVAPDFGGGLPEADPPPDTSADDETREPAPCPWAASGVQDGWLIRPVLAIASFAIR